MTRTPSPKSLAYWARMRNAPRSEAGKIKVANDKLKVHKRAFRQTVKDHMLKWIIEHPKLRFYTNRTLLPLVYKSAFIKHVDQSHPGNTYSSGPLTIIRAAAKALTEEDKLVMHKENVKIAGTKRGVYPVKYYEVKKDE